MGRDQKTSMSSVLLAIEPVRHVVERPGTVRPVQRRDEPLVAEQQLLTLAEPTRHGPLADFKELGLDEGVEDIAVVDVEEHGGDGLP